MHFYIRIKRFHGATRVVFSKSKDTHDGVYFKHYSVCERGCNLVTLGLCLGKHGSEKKEEKFDLG